MSTPAAGGEGQERSPLREIVQPFVDLVHAPRALWGINLAYVIEGMVYFGMLGYLAIYFSDFVFQGVERADEWSHKMVMVLTAGITIAMFFLGFVADKRGVRFALIAAFALMLLGRILWSGGPNVFGLEPVRPGVFAGDRVSLHVTRLETRDGVRMISAATPVAIEPGAAPSASGFALDLARGAGTPPSAELEARLVRLSRATVIDGAQQTWQVQYGDGPVTARLFAVAAAQVRLCRGAVITLDSGYVTLWKEKNEWVIRSNWAEDFSEVDTSACAPEDLRKIRPEDGRLEQLWRPRARWTPVPEAARAAAARPVSIAALRDLPDGPTNVLLPDSCVTYVRNGGYFLQTDPDGPAIAAFVPPFWSPLHLVTLAGMLVVVVGYGMYQPAAYAGVRQFTTPKTAAMGFAMLYALMNLGGWLPTFAFLLRDENYLGLGIPGTYWVYTGFTLCALLATITILNRRTAEAAIAAARTETARIKAEEEARKPGGAEAPPPGPAEPVAEGVGRLRIKPHLWLFWLLGMALFLFRNERPWYHTWEDALWRWVAAGLIFLSPLVFALVRPARAWLARHPLADGKFAYFIFALIPVQTLFTYNWLVLPQYINRAFEGWIGDYFEIAANANPILIFIAVPIITALSQKAKVYNMMILGTFIMSAPAFLNALGPHWWALFGYILIMTIGEAMWQPRFLQYAAEIAPEGRTGQYMGVAQLPWFLTKVLVPLLYSGWMMDRYCPAEGPKNTQFMWLVFGCIAVSSTVLLLLAKGWIGRDFRTRAA